MKVGSLVECIEDRYDTFYYESIPIKGGIYTVRSLERKDGIYLEEIINPPNQDCKGEEPSFWREHFREIQPPMSLEFIQELQFELV